MRSTFIPAPPAASTELPPARATESLGPPGLGAHPPTPGFASLLHQHVARTAVAEGQTKTATETGGHRAGDVRARADHSKRAGTHRRKSTNDRAADAGAASAPPAVGQQPAPASQHPSRAVAQQPAMQPPAAQQPTPQQPASTSVAPAVSAQQPSAAAAQQANVASAQPVTAALLAQPQPTAQVHDAQAPGAQAEAAPGQPNQVQPSQPQAPDPFALAAQPLAQTPAPAQPAATAAGATAHPAGDAPTAAPPAPQSSGANQHGDPSPGDAAQPQDVRAGLHSLLSQPSDAPSGPALNLHASAAPAATAPAPAPAATPAQPVAAAQPLSVSTANAPTTPATPAPGAPAAPTAAPVRYAVPLEHTVETVRMTVAPGVREGFTQARIQLAPATLGQIRINLQRTPEGVVAKVVAEHQAAAQTLGQAGEELKRSLQDAGVNLVRLDIEARGEGASAGNDPNRSDAGARANRAATNDSAAAPASADPAPGEQTLTLPSGVLVNVLA